MITPSLVCLFLVLGLSQTNEAGKSPSTIERDASMLSFPVFQGDVKGGKFARMRAKFRVGPTIDKILENSVSVPLSFNVTAAPKVIEVKPVRVLTSAQILQAVSSFKIVSPKVEQKAAPSIPFRNIFQWRPLSKPEMKRPTTLGSLLGMVPPPPQPVRNSTVTKPFSLNDLFNFTATISITNASSGVIIEKSSIKNLTVPLPNVVNQFNVSVSKNSSHVKLFFPFLVRGSTMINIVTQFKSQKREAESTQPKLAKEPSQERSTRQFNGGFGGDFGGDFGGGGFGGGGFGGGGFGGGFSGAGFGGGHNFNNNNAGGFGGHNFNNNNAGGFGSNFNNNNANGFGSNFNNNNGK